MFSRFDLVGGGHLYVRTADIRQFLTNADGKTTVCWELGEKPQFTAIQGSADENMERLRQEETDMLIASEKLRMRQQNGYPAMPVVRGRK